jgi:uncharacterized protein YndB with AHSA1/START domain
LAVCVITTAMSAVIEAEPRCVWRALTDPDELCAWDENLLAPVDPPEGYPCVDAPQRWRYLLRGIQVLMHERPLEVAPGRRLRSSLALGGMKLEQTYTLTPEAESRTRVSVGIVASNSIPVLGGTIDRFEVRQLVAERADSQLRALQKWCEARPDAQMCSSSRTQRSGVSKRSPASGARSTVS